MSTGGWPGHGGIPFVPARESGPGSLFPRASRIAAWLGRLCGAKEEQ
jgi:hypothetical protein